MELKGKVTEICQAVTGEGKKGTWQKQIFIIEDDGEYQKQKAIVVWNCKPDISDLRIGEEVIVSVNVESREFNENWFTDVKAWKVERTKSVQKSDGKIDLSENPMDNNDDLPF